MSDKIAIRAEQHGNIQEIRSLLVAAFEGEAEAKLVDALREANRMVVSLVAVEQDRVVGHIAFSEVTIDSNPDEVRLVGLAPVAVTPERQGEGVGKQLIANGMDACRRLGYDAVVLLGEPAYYQKFGFRPAAAFDLDSQYNAGDAFMAVELRKGSLTNCRGTVRYCPMFDDLS